EALRRLHSATVSGRGVVHRAGTARAMSASAARQHLEWLRFAEPTGPFLSLPTLLRAFPQGVEKLGRERAEDLAERLAEWREATGAASPDLAVHRNWCLFVLRSVLGWSGDVLLEAGSGVVLPSAT